jgi:hypothetical protein
MLQAFSIGPLYLNVKWKPPNIDSGAKRTAMMTKREFLKVAHALDSKGRLTNWALGTSNSAPAGCLKRQMLVKSEGSS